jgi:hypothetical protein
VSLKLFYSIFSAAFSSHQQGSVSFGSNTDEFWDPFLASLKPDLNHLTSEKLKRKVKREIMRIIEQVLEEDNNLKEK